MSSSSETKNQLFVILCLTISLTKSQRVTLLSSQLTSNIDGWLTDNTLSSVNGFIVNNPTYCPSGGNCYTFSTNDELYRHVDTRGYRDIQIGYDIRTLNTRGDLGYACRFYWMKGTRVSGDPGWVHQQSHVCDSATCNILHTALPNDVDNTKTICIDFWMDSPGWCHLNNVVVTGISIVTTSEPTQKLTPEPTLKSTPNPTRKPTFQPEPTLKPIAKPTPEPVTFQPTSKPTSTPTHSPILNTVRTLGPTLNPTSKPTSKPTLNPIVKSTDPGVSTCDDTIIGTYNGVPVTLLVHIPFEGGLQFNAQSSTFQVTDMEAFSRLNVPLGTDLDNDEIITLINVPAGDYQFIIYGGSATSGTFEATIRCFSASPTSNPTRVPYTEEERTERTTSALEIGIVVICVSIVCCLCCAILGCVYKKRHGNKTELEQVEIVHRGIINAVEAQHVVPEDDFDRDLVISWLTRQVKLPRYASVFVDHGYDSMRIIQAIESRTELNEIGIHDTAHQTVILHEINKIRDIDYTMGTNDKCGMDKRSRAKCTLNTVNSKEYNREGERHKDVLVTQEGDTDENDDMIEEMRSTVEGIE
eukprot:137723_1